MADAPDPADPNVLGQTNADELREHAEQRLDRLVGAYVDHSELTREGLAAVVHELRVHQIELEMQNEELREAQLALDEQREKYFDLFDRAPVGYLTIDTNGMVTNANLTAARLLGVQRQMLVGKPFSAFVFAADRDTYYLHMKAMEKTFQPQTFEVQLARVSGIAAVESGHFWAAFESLPQGVTDGAPSSWLVTFSDITERRVVEKALQDSEARHSSMVASISDVIGIMGADGIMKYKSPNIEKWFGWKPQDLVGTDGWQTVHPDDVERLQAEFATILAKDGGTVSVEYDYKCKDGSYKPVELTAINLVNDPTIGGVLLNYRDITARRHLQEELQRRATTDDLTEVSNRRQFTELAQREISRAGRHHGPVAVALLDIDHFKRINDTFGHSAGDQALIAFVSACKTIIREIDVLARIGGDEFALLLPETTVEQARATAERIRLAVGGLPIESAGIHVSMTVSVGVAGLSAGGETLDELMSCADQALYQAKEAGRNRTVVDAAAAADQSA
ncbi:MAG: diguanylate cyclase [Coriobacteriia bacterium]